MIKKSRLNELQSKIDTLIFHYGDSDKKLKSELEAMAQTIRHEQELRGEVFNILSNVIGKL